MSDLNEYELAIVDAAHAWWSAKAGIVAVSSMTPEEQHLYRAVEGERDRFMRAREFGPTPASQDPFYVKDLDAIRDRQDAQAEAIKRIRDRLREAELAIEHVRSFLGPAFRDWEEH